MKMVYGVNEKPPIDKLLLGAFQELLAILAATIAVPAIIGNGMSQSAALFGAGIGTLIYVLFTKRKSPVFLGSSFAFLGSMAAAFAGAVTVELGYMGLIIGAVLAGFVYVLIALLTNVTGTDWLFKIMPKVVIGPTVAIIGLSLAGNAIGDLMNSAALDNGTLTLTNGLCIICGLVTLIVTIIASVYGNKSFKMIPFIIGIGAGYVVASLLTVYGFISHNDLFKIIDFTKFSALADASSWLPEFTFIKAFKFDAWGYGEFGNFGAYLLTIFIAYVPVAFVVFAEHVADHRNLGDIIGVHLLRNDPGLKYTLLGDGVGSMVGAFFGGCPNTTYGESVACVAISGNASVHTTILTAVMAIIASFIAPFTILLSTIPSCVMGGVCVALYGFIAVSGLKMIQKVDLNANHNLFVVSVILIAGIGGFSLNFGKVTITPVACALILGIIVNWICKKAAVKAKTKEEIEEEKAEQSF